MYRTDVYFLAKITADIPIYTLIGMLGTTICYYSIGLNDEFSRYILCNIIIILVIYVVMGAGMHFSILGSTKLTRFF